MNKGNDFKESKSLAWSDDGSLNFDSPDAENYSIFVLKLFASNALFINLPPPLCMLYALCT